MSVATFDRSSFPPESQERDRRDRGSEQRNTVFIDRTGTPAGDLVRRFSLQQAECAADRMVHRGHEITSTPCGVWMSRIYEPDHWQRLSRPPRSSEPSQNQQCTA